MVDSPWYIGLGEGRRESSGQVDSDQAVLLQGARGAIAGPVGDANVYQQARALPVVEITYGGGDGPPGYQYPSGSGQ